MRLSEAQWAHLCGVACAGGSSSQGSVVVHLRQESPLLYLLEEYGCRLEQDKPSQRGRRVVVSGELAARLCRELGPTLQDVALQSWSASLQRAFLRGVLEQSATIRLEGPAGLTLELVSPRGLKEADWQHMVGSVPCFFGGTVRLFDTAALDFLGLLFEPEGDEEPPLVLASHQRMYERACLYVEQGTSGWPGVQVQRLSPEAVLPFKARTSDSGYDLTLIKVGRRLGRVVLYHTGLRVVPPPGWYFDVVPRSSIIKLGYLLANSVGVIDRSYRGEILVPLIKWDESAPDLELPQRVVQMVPRPVVHFRIEETQDLNAGLRGDRGFGSSGRL